MKRISNVVAHLENAMANVAMDVFLITTVAAVRAEQAAFTTADTAMEKIGGKPFFKSKKQLRRAYDSRVSHIIDVAADYGTVPEILDAAVWSLKDLVKDAGAGAKPKPAGFFPSVDEVKAAHAKVVALTSRLEIEKKKVVALTSRLEFADSQEEFLRGQLKESEFDFRQAKKDCEKEKGLADSRARLLHKRETEIKELQRRLEATLALVEDKGAREVLTAVVDELDGTRESSAMIEALYKVSSDLAWQRDDVAARLESAETRIKGYELDMDGLRQKLADVEALVGTEMPESEYKALQSEDLY